MAKATIKSKTGAVIAVEGTQKEVAEILAAIERTAVVGQTKSVMSQARAERKEQKRRANASDLVIELKEEGYFDKPQGLAAIGHALEEKGYVCPVTTLSGVMLGLVQKKLFRRKKVDGKWAY